MVGRILYLKNNHIPPMKTDLKSEYLSLGSYDGLSVSNNVFADNKNDLLKIWLQSVKDTYEMKGGYSSQAMYLFSDCDKDLDNHFWNNNDYSLLFLIAIQLNKRDDKLEAVSKEIEKQIKKFYYNNGIDAIFSSYLMLDGNDILLAIKCNNYKLGKIITSSLHTKNNGIVISEKIYYVSNSFTITGINKTADGSNIDGLPDYCHIQLIEKYPGAIKEIFDSPILQDVKDKKSYPIFGRDDEIFMFKPESWPLILSLYQNNGLFYNNEDYRKRLLSVSTRFLCSIDEKITFGEGEINYEFDDNDEEKNTICSQLRKKIEQLYQNNLDRIDEGRNNVLIYNSCACYKSIWQILNSIEKFEFKVFPDYIYISIYAPLTMLINKIAEKENANKDDESGIVYAENIKETYSFLGAINQISQNLIRAERQFQQIPELNANSYNIPIKLHAFYAAFVYNVKNFLNKNFGTGNFYEFTLYPGMNEQLNVKRVFYSSKDNKRLFLMKIPEKQVFDINHLMICLCHEVGHFVGSNLRQRERRYIAIKDAVARMICLHLYINEKVKKYITKDGLDYLLNFAQKQIALCIDRTKKEIEENSKHTCDTVLHSENLNPIIIQGINSYIMEAVKNNNEFDFIFVRYIEEKEVGKSKLSVEEIEQSKQEYDDSIRSYFFNIQSNINSENTEISVQNMVTQLFSFAKECFADLVSVLILDLNFKDYCQSIFKSLPEYEIKDIAYSDLVIRIALVATAMSMEVADSENGKTYENRWNMDDAIVWKNEETNENVKVFLEKVWECLCYGYRSYDNQNYNCSQNNSAFMRLKDIEAESVFSVFRDYELLCYLYRYLSECRLCFEKNVNCECEKERKKIKSVFKKLTKESTIVEKINCINSVNSEYDELVRKKVHETLNSTEK